MGGVGGARRGPALSQAAEAEALLRELLFLRKDAGFTPPRLAKAPLLRQLLGSSSEPYAGLLERFVSAVQSLHNPEAELLLDVFGLTPETTELSLLKDRREHHGRKLGVGAYTVASREAAALEHLRIQLTTGWYPKSPAAIRVPQSHNGVIQEYAELVTVVNDRRWQESREHYRFIAAFDEAEFIALSRSVPGIPIPEGDEFTVQTKRIGESFTHRFFHREPMRRGRAYDLRFRMVPDPAFDDTELLTEESRAFHEPTRTAVFEAVFIGPKPAVVWSYERLTFFERPGEPRAGRVLDFGGGASVRAVFHDLYGGLFSGVAWGW